MLRLDWGYRKAHIWLGELPPWTYTVAETVEAMPPAARSPIPSRRQAAIELYVPMGGRALYGGLGAEFTPDDTERLVIQVCASAQGEQRLIGALCDPGDSAHLGVPREYVRGILSAASDSECARSLGSGALTFCHGAHGVIGSSFWFFGVLTRLVIWALTATEQPLVEADFIKLVQRELRRPPTQSAR